MQHTWADEKTFTLKNAQNLILSRHALMRVEKWSVFTNVFLKIQGYDLYDSRRYSSGSDRKPIVRF